MLIEVGVICSSILQNIILTMKLLNVLIMACFGEHVITMQVPRTRLGLQVINDSPTSPPTQNRLKPDI